VRFIGLDVHKDFCEVAVAEGAARFSGPRVRSTHEDLEVFRQSLSRDDHWCSRPPEERSPWPGSSSATPAGR
jgi:hypothetical protein